MRQKKSRTATRRRSARPLPTRAIAAAIVALALVAAALALYLFTGRDGTQPQADPSDAQAVALGARIYRDHCATCHGINLEGQPDWQRRRPDGRLPAPPHDETGHTWHHADKVLFDITKHGIAVLNIPGYESDMPGFAGTLTDDEIRAVLAYIKSRWPQEVQRIQADIDRRARQ
jgi:mono/diheme cytochrome c family protein